jgi:hypothetical protein
MDLSSFDAPVVSPAEVYLWRMARTLPLMPYLLLAGVGRTGQAKADSW